MKRELVRSVLIALPLMLIASGCAVLSNSDVESNSIAALPDSGDRSNVPLETSLESSRTSHNSETPVDLIEAKNLNENTNRTLSSVSSDGVGVELLSDSHSQILKLTTGNPKSQFKVSKLQSPDRIVLDLTGTRFRKNASFPASDNSYLSAIRLGAHKNADRVVIDLKEPVNETISQSNDVITIALNKIQSDKTEAEKTEAEKTEPDNLALNNQDNSSETQKTETAADDSKIEESSMNTSTEDVSRNPKTELITADITPVGPTLHQQSSLIENKDSSPRVKNISLDSVAGKGNIVVADLSSISSYEFKKTAPSEYVAILRGASLDPQANKTLLSESQTSGIRSVRPVEKNGDVLLRVFAQPETELVAAKKNDALVIRTIDPNVDFMAQPNIAAALPSVTETVKDTPVKEIPVKETPVKEASKDDSKEIKKDHAKTPDTTAKDVKISDGKKSLSPPTAIGSNGQYSGALISLELQDADIDSALRIIAEVSNLNIIASSDVQGKVTLRLQNVPWDQALDVILKTNGLDKVQEGNVVRIAPVEKLRLEREALKQSQLAEEELEPLTVKYARVSYAKADDIKPLIKSVLTERGDVAVDSRSNQLIIKDIKKGLKAALDLVAKLDLRTPQVLLETQIVESSRSFLRDLGAQLGFSFIQSPQTGNATGLNFPNSISVGGGIPGSTNASNFPASITGSDGGSAIKIAFGSADGTRSLDANISALEREGRIKIISRPSVATTNNKAAEITSNETVAILMPNGGTTTVVGGNSGGGGSATEKIKAGITLKVTPQASPDYYILLDIQAESSNFSSRIVNNIPGLFERKATSTVLVSSGQTFAIGGIYRTTDRDTIKGVPFLKDIPVLGNLFSGNTVDVADEELLFFITPRIIEGSFDDAAMTTEGL